MRLAQPTVSTQLRKLSETLGLKLLERSEGRLAALRATCDEVLRLAAASGTEYD